MPPLRRVPQRTLLVVLAPLTVVLAGCTGPDLIDRLSQQQWGFCGTIIVVLDIVALVDLLGGDYGTTGKVLWSLLIVFFPVGGVVLYFLLGR